MVQSNAISTEGNAGKVEDFDKVKLWLQNKTKMGKVMWLKFHWQNMWTHIWYINHIRQSDYVAENWLLLHNRVSVQLHKPDYPDLSDVPFHNINMSGQYPVHSNFGVEY